ncbi:MAG: GTP 3',8-cyclase MoaA [Armatimonadetes bacterium]|nr:GTP 3',8-cyclase MoaA [Armatimonadota bacterium]
METLCQSESVWSPLVDRFGRTHTYLRVSLTDRCNFRCTYCMPKRGIEWMPSKSLLGDDEVVRLASVFARLGVTKIRLTGGEPAIRKGFVELVGRIKAIPGVEKLLMTTNGTALRANAERLHRAGLDGLNISIDSLQPERFKTITHRDVLSEVLAGIEAALEAGIPVKLNVVVMPGVNDDELLDFVELTRSKPITVRFIEFMPFSGNEWKADKVFGYREMRSVIEAKYALLQRDGEPSEVAKEFRIEGFKGTVGFITSMTEDFCSDCNRVRLTADGRLKTCLFLAPKNSLRDMARTGSCDEEIAAAIHSGLQTKWAGHPPMGAWKQYDNLSMVQIGG